MKNLVLPSHSGEKINGFSTLSKQSNDNYELDKFGFHHKTLRIEVDSKILENAKIPSLYKLGTLKWKFTTPFPLKNNFKLKFKYTETSA